MRVDRDLALLHRLEQRRLRLRRRAVDLVGEHDVGEHAAGAELELVGRAVPHRHAGHVGRQEVGRELDALARAADRAGDRLRQRRLADARDVFDEEVPLGEQAHEREVDRVALALDHAFDVGEQRVEQAAERRFAARRGSGLNHAGSLQGTNADGTRGLRARCTVASTGGTLGVARLLVAGGARRAPAPAPLVDGGRARPGGSPDPVGGDAHRSCRFPTPTTSRSGSRRSTAPTAVPSPGRGHLPRVVPGTGQPSSHERTGRLPPIGESPGTRRYRTLGESAAAQRQLRAALRRADAPGRRPRAEGEGRDRRAQRRRAALRARRRCRSPR